MEQTKRRVTVPVPAEELKRADPLAVLQERARRAGRELPLMQPLTRRTERILVLVIAAVLVIASAATLLLSDDKIFGWILVGMSTVIVVALVVAHLFGGIDAAGRTSILRPRAKSESSGFDGSHSPIAHGRTLSASSQPATGNAVILPSSRQIASARRRLVARLIDLAAMVACLAGASLLIDDRQPIAMLGVAAAILFLLPGLVLWLTNGSSPGKRIVGIRVIRTDGHPMTFGRALNREFNSVAALLGFAHAVVLASTMLADRLGRTQADLRTGTIVVREDRSTC